MELQQTVRKRFQKLDVTTSLKIVYSARKGVYAQVFYDFAEAARIPEAALAGLLQVSARTVGNYAERKKPFNPVQGEHLLKLISLYEKGEAIFGNVDEFNYWLRKPFWDRQETPQEWLATPGGVDLLMLELDRLAHAYPV